MLHLIEDDLLEVTEGLPGWLAEELARLEADVEAYLRKRDDFARFLRERGGELPI